MSNDKITIALRNSGAMCNDCLVKDACISIATVNDECRVMEANGEVIRRREMCPRCGGDKPVNHLVTPPEEEDVDDAEDAPENEKITFALTAFGAMCNLCLVMDACFSHLSTVNEECRRLAERGGLKRRLEMCPRCGVDAPVNHLATV